MHYTTAGIVLGKIRYQEKNLIVKCYTESFGMVSYFVRNAFGSSRKNGLISYFQPLSLIKITGNFKGKGHLEYFSEVRMHHPQTSISIDYNKSTVALFLSDVLMHTIKESDANPGLYAYLETALLWFDTHDFHPDFHLIVMIQISKYLGFYPEINLGNDYLSPREGVFSSQIYSDSFNFAESQLFLRLMQSKMNVETTFNQSERRQLLQLLMTYYNYHIPNFSKVSSLDVLMDMY